MTIDYNHYYYKYKALKYYLKNESIKIHGGAAFGDEKNPGKELLEKINFRNAEEHLLPSIKSLKMNYENEVFTLEGKQDISKNSVLGEIINDDTWNKKGSQHGDHLKHLFLAVDIEKKKDLALVGISQTEQEYIHYINIQFTNFSVENLDNEQLSEDIRQHELIFGTDNDYINKLNKKLGSIKKIIRIKSHIDQENNFVTYKNRYYHWFLRNEPKLQTSIRSNIENVKKGTIVNVDLYLDNDNNILFTDINIFNK